MLHIFNVFRRKMCKNTGEKKFFHFLNFVSDFKIYLVHFTLSWNFILLQIQRGAFKSDLSLLFNIVKNSHPKMLF